MATQFKLPELGENVDKASVARVLVSVGDSIAADQPVIEVETDKAVAEIPTDMSGTVTAISVSEGDTITVGTVVLELDTSGAAPAKAPEPEPEKQPEKKAEKPEEAKAETPAPKEAPAPAPAPAVDRQRQSGPVLASPSVRRMAREHGVDLHDVPVVEPGRPVSAGDLAAYLREREQAPAEAAPTPKEAPALSPTPAPAVPADATRDSWGPVTDEPMNGVRKATAKHMAHCWATIPHVTQFEKVDITGIEELRKKHGAKVKAEGGRLTVTIFVLKALAEALKRFPTLNASVDMDGESIQLKHYYNLGVAVDTPNGLLVPVLRDVDQKSLLELAHELPALAAKARDRKLKASDMQGGTFTVTNLGGLGVTSFTPIVNAPEVAILGVSQSQVEPVFQNGQFVPRLLMPLSLSYDHRVIDGADAARFMAWLKEALENPWALFLGSV